MINTLYPWFQPNKYKNVSFGNKDKQSINPHKNWNEVYQLGLNKIPWDSQEWRKMSAECVDNFLAESSLDILEYGFGTGHLINHLRSKGNNITGVEKSSDMVELFKNLNPEIEVMRVDHPDEIGNKLFDAITCMGVFHHINPLEYDSFLNSFSKMLKPNGKIVLGGWDKSDKNFNFRPFLVSPYTGDKTYPINHIDNNIEDSIKRNNFNIIESGIIKFVAPEHNQDRLFRYYFLKKN